MGTDKQQAEEKFSELKQRLRGMKRLAVAFSGGVDSAFLLKVAADALGPDNVLALTALSETTPRRERRDAVNLARLIGAPLYQEQTRELEAPEFTRNAEDKCYVCKKLRFSRLTAIAGEQGFDLTADGGNLDDAQDYRPGMRAVRELGVKSPLSDAGLTKADIRLLSKELGLPTWDKPALACLATRIPYHSPITAEKLKQADAAEERLISLGFSPRLRVRHDGHACRIEIDPADIPKIADAGLRNDIVRDLKALGFTYVALDLEGYRMGSLNKTINTGR